MWTNFLRLGSLTIFCIALLGCERMINREWVHTGDWIYLNDSSYTLELKGAVTKFTSSNPPLINFTLRPGVSYCVQYLSDGEKSIPPEYLLNPFQPYLSGPDREVQIVINGAVTITIEEGTGIRDRSNYEVEKLTDRHYRFTYTFTDTIVQSLMR